MKSIPGFKGRYQISTSGNIKDLKTGRFITPHMSGVPRRNYHQVTLYMEGKKFTKRVHSWMAITYLNHKYGDRKVVVDHIDNNPLNNKLSNLMVISMRLNNTKDRVKLVT
jgi:hypothetical protein